MPLDVLPYQQQMEKFGFIPANHEKPNWFPVKLGDVYDERGKSVPGYRRVYRDDSGDTLAVHSDKYRLISYDKTFQAFDEALHHSGLRLDGMHVATDLTHNGARCFRQYILPAHLVEVGDNDHMALRIIMFNSYDGSTRFSGRSGGYRFVCANMCILGSDLVNIGMKHVGNEDKDHKIELTIHKLIADTASAIKRMETMKLWKHRYPTSEEYKNALQEEFPQVSETLVDRFLSQFSLSEDRSLFGFYNVMTSWATHTDHELRRENQAYTRTTREQRVAAFLNSTSWRTLEVA